MPDAKNNAKLTGDTHPPEVEDAGRSPPKNAREGAQGDGGTPAADDLAGDLENESRPGKGENQAGYLKDKDDGAGKKDKP